MPIILWSARIWSSATILYHDSQSTILLENNGRKSSSKRAKDFNCQQHTEYCPTEEMVGAFITNPCKKVNSFTTLEISTWTCRSDYHQHFASQSVLEKHIYYPWLNLYDDWRLLTPYLFSSTAVIQTQTQRYRYCALAHEFWFQSYSSFLIRLYISKRSQPWSSFFSKILFVSNFHKFLW